MGVGPPHAAGDPRGVSLLGRTVPERGGGKRTPPRQPQQPQSESGPLPLCQDLVVPSGCECELLVPIHLEHESQRKYPIADAEGLVVLYVSTTSGEMTTARGGASYDSGWQATLHGGGSGGGGGGMLACCRAMGPAEFHFLHANGAYFGKLTRSSTEDGFVLTTLSGARLHFWGSFKDHALNITDEAGKLCATTELSMAEPPSSGEACCRLRAAPQVDVGVMLCSLLCIGKSA